MDDVIVIGSGIGGLTAAGLLARVAGKKVLVLEKHTEPGGLTHVFRRDGASWDVGLHYVGNLDPGSMTRKLFDYLSDNQLSWNRMIDSFECFVYPGRRLAIPSDPKAYKELLLQTYPSEAKAINRYFLDIKQVALWATLGFVRGMTPNPISSIVGLIQRIAEAKATQTTETYLHNNFCSPELRAVIATQWGDYGLPPSRSAFAIHALIVNHYLHGAWFPDGGASSIARTFDRGVEQAGGTVRVAQEVTRILVDNGQAVGVEVIDRRGPRHNIVNYYAPVIISNVGASLTFEKLLPTDGYIGDQTSEIRECMRRLGRGLSAVILYLRLKSDPRSIGVNGENFWINSDLDHDDIEGQTAGLLNGSPKKIYVSFPSIKSGDTRFHTAEIIAFLEGKVFEPWSEYPKGERGAEYSALKKRIGNGMLNFANSTIPGLSALVEYAELGTPLTIEHYTSHPNGCFYGLPSTPERFRSKLFGPRTPIKGLYISGSDAGSLGIVGAMMGGVAAASQVLGSTGMPIILSEIVRGPKIPDQCILPKEKKKAILCAKEALTPSIWRLQFKVTGDIEDYVPGQFARLNVGGIQWRDYSIANIQGQTITFLVSTRTGGDGSNFVLNALIGTLTEIELPLGQYTLRDTARRKIFIATGTGVAPFLPMFELLAKEGKLEIAMLIFGCRTISEDITRHLFPLPSTVIRCYSQEHATHREMSGRVTNALSSISFAPEETEFYICGSSSMVADAKNILEKRGAVYFNIENF